MDRQRAPQKLVGLRQIALVPQDHAEITEAFGDEAGAGGELLADGQGEAEVFLGRLPVAPRLGDEPQVLEAA